jgi:hypothetical protein
MRHTRINPGLGLSPQEGSMSSPRARITLRPELARSSWLDTMMGKSLRKIGRDRQGKQCKDVFFWLVLSRGFPQQKHPAGCQTLNGHTLGMPLLVWHSRHTNLGPEERKSLCGHQNDTYQCQGPCLHRPENWLVRQLNDEPKLVYKVGFIRRKEKATAREAQRNPEASSSLHRWRLSFYGYSKSRLGGFFSLAMDSQAFLDELVCLPLYWGKGTILRAFCSSALW